MESLPTCKADTCIWFFCSVALISSIWASVEEALSAVRGFGPRIMLVKPCARANSTLAGV